MTERPFLTEPEYLEVIKKATFASSPVDQVEYRHALPNEVLFFRAFHGTENNDRLVGFYGSTPMVLCDRLPQEEERAMKWKNRKQAKRTEGDSGLG